MHTPGDFVRNLGAHKPLVVVHEYLDAMKTWYHISDVPHSGMSIANPGTIL